MEEAEIINCDNCNIKGNSVLKIDCYNIDECPKMSPEIC